MGILPRRADLKKSGEWMADAFPGASERGRRTIRRQPELSALTGLVVTACLVLATILLLVVVLADRFG